MSLTTSILRGGVNNHQTTSEEANGIYTDFVNEGIVGSIANTGGVAPATGGFAVNATGTPDTNVQISAGVSYVTGTPTSQNSQTFRIKNTATVTLPISSNTSGSTKYDWIYIKIDATKLNGPNTAGDDVATIVASRSSSSTADDGTPPTYSYPIAVVTVANGFSTITNGNIQDIRTQTGTTANITGAESALVTIRNNMFFDFIASGCVWTADSAGSNRNASSTAGVVYIAGKRLTVASVTARSFTASKDVYCDLKDNGDGTAIWVYFDNTTNAASPSFATTGGTMRGAIIVVGAGSIANAAAINQGEENKVLPIASSIPYTVTDSLGNLICPRDPNRSTLGYRQAIANQGSITSTSAVQVTALSCPIVVNNPRKIEIKGHIPNAALGAAGNIFVSIWDGTVGSGTLLQEDEFTIAGAGFVANFSPDAESTPATTSKTYNIGIRVSTNTATITSSSTAPSWIRIKYA